MLTKHTFAVCNVEQETLKILSLSRFHFKSLKSRHFSFETGYFL